MGRFDYVKYNKAAESIQALFKQKFQELEADVAVLADGRAKSLILTKLEEAYMWVGKALRDQQVATDPSTVLQEERNNS